MAETPRDIAVLLIEDVLIHRTPLSDAMPARLGKLAPEKRAEAQRLALLALRGLGRADKVLGRLLRKPPLPRVRTVLRLATAELLGDGAAPHGVVSEAVGSIKRHRPSARSSGLVNAVLRRVAEEGQAVWDQAGPTRLPKWLRGRLIATYGSDAVAAFEAAHEVGAPIDLSAKDGVSVGKAEVLPTGSLRWRGSGALTALTPWQDGDMWVQDAAAALPVKLLAPRAGETVVDLCAAPGGKTLQLASAGAKVTAVDLSEDRMHRLHENLARTGLSAEVVVADVLTWMPADKVDAVLLDAPCSATGTIRRHPDLPHVKDGKGLKALFDLQSAIIDRAVEMLKPGGRMVFCTCSLLPEEGERQAEGAMARHPGLQPLAYCDWAEERWKTPLGLRLRPDFWPDRGGMDGFFVAGFRKA